MLLLSLFLLLNLIRHSEQVIDIPKCCQDSFNPQIDENGTITCEEMPNWNHQFWSDTTNFVEQNEFGKCVDVEENNFYQYKFNNSMLISKNLLTLDPSIISRKCCPLKYVYNRVTRSCHLTANAAFLKHQFVKVALPDCEKQLITDSTFKSSTEAQAKIFNMKDNNYCFDQDVNTEIVVRECSAKLNVCKLKRCIKKCCPDGQSYESNKCVNSFVHGLLIQDQDYSEYINNITGK